MEANNNVKFVQLSESAVAITVAFLGILSLATEGAVQQLIVFPFSSSMEMNTCDMLLSQSDSTGDTLKDLDPCPWITIGQLYLLNKKKNITLHVRIVSQTKINFYVV